VAQNLNSTVFYANPRLRRCSLQSSGNRIYSAACVPQIGRLFAAEDCADNICEKDGISVTVSKPHTSNAAAHGRFVLWGNAARLDESRQERRSHTE